MGLLFAVGRVCVSRSVAYLHQIRPLSFVVDCTLEETASAVPCVRPQSDNVPPTEPPLAPNPFVVVPPLTNAGWQRDYSLQ